MSNPVLRRRQAATYLGVSVGTFLKLRREDPTFPTPIQITDLLLGWRRADLDAWIESKRKAS